MPTNRPLILTVNSGSSSLKFACFALDSLRRVAGGTVERIGTASARLDLRDADGRTTADVPVAAHGPSDALAGTLDHLAKAGLLRDVAAVGHRFVHGGPRFRAPVRITPEVRGALDAIIPLAPEHLPRELAGVDAIALAIPTAAQVACFDTAFHRTMPREAEWFALPRQLAERGVVRYGFHGLSYEYVVDALRREGALPHRLVVAHLGNGASLAAIRDGRSIDTSMGLTPMSGIPMSTRSGDLDPGVLLYLAAYEGHPTDDLRRIVSRESGLLGLSQTSGDMRDLLAHEASDERAHDAITIFCYQVKRWIGSYVAALGGLDTLAFTGGIGEHAAPVRARICAGLDCFGIVLDEARNDAGAPLISGSGSRVAVRVVRTDEEIMIARHTRRVLDESQEPSP